MLAAWRHSVAFKEAGQSLAHGLRSSHSGWRETVPQLGHTDAPPAGAVIDHGQYPGKADLNLANPDGDLEYDALLTATGGRDNHVWSVEEIEALLS